ncbi:uncharacterized protein FOMMEDRAFT_119641 [Fomitiporia mediterranea MF3/22]|uniref:uncharacterized protein n=1 Tax=Fomitiporia mediterranea (strain MF3/22) TaxID=694068 RepID=UPI00044098C1|nr:uncharacterized protein FOMMEDRAFT_119641 [Fomitiporia mediterranea MF3/22]EJD06118.1 hypothetical protein FOMMEDRAFT_119641 [Fomitiporia mediterranea MF3/22]
MRRKSSAQTLLSSFKSSPGNPPTTAPATQLTMQIPAALNSGLGGFPPGGTSTPISSTQREWDAQSMKSDSITSSTAPLNQGGANGSPAIPQGTSLESLRDLTMKRMITLTYLRNVHEGRSHWFNTVMMTKADLDRKFNNLTMRKRTLSFAILGMSLSGVFDNTNSNDFCKSLLNILTEYEQSKEENYKPKMRFFKSNKMPRRGTNAMNDYAMTVPEAGEASFLVAPHIPFPLDYHQTLLSLLDILSEVYHRLSKILGPSPFPNTGQYMMGPLGALSPAPGVSYLFQGNESNMSHDGESSSLWGIANASGYTLPGGGGPMMSPPATWSPVLGDMMLKIDGKLKKIIGLLLKELDELARNAIQEELASLDPLLRNQTVSDGIGIGREQYDFDTVF